MIGYILKEKHMTSGIFYKTWEELVETLEGMEDPKTGFTIDTCIYYEGDFKEKSDE